MAIERAAVPLRFLGRAEPDGDSLYAALEASGFRPVRAIERLRAVVVGAAEAALLGVPEGAAALDIHRIAYVADGRRVEFTRITYRSDTYDFVAELTLSPSAPRADGRSRPMTASWRPKSPKPARRSGGSSTPTRALIADLAAELRAGEPSFVATIARGSSDHAALFLKHVIELKLGLACASLGPSIASLYHASLRLDRRRRDHHLAVGPQPGHRRHAAGGEAGGRDDDRASSTTSTSPAACDADALFPLHAGEERSVAATKSMIASLVAGALACRALERRRRPCRRARSPARDPRRLARRAAATRPSKRSRRPTRST